MLDESMDALSQYISQQDFSQVGVCSLSGSDHPDIDKLETDSILSQDAHAEFEGYSHEQPEGSLDMDIHSRTGQIDSLPPFDASSPSYVPQQQVENSTCAVPLMNPSAIDDATSLDSYSQGYDVYDLGINTAYGGTTTSSTQSVLYSLLVEASRHWSSSSSGPQQQVDTPSLNDFINISEDNTAVDFDSEVEYDEDEDEDPESTGEVDVTYICPTNPAVQQTSPECKCVVCGKVFHAQKAITRHFDDVHSEKRKCPQPECAEMIRGKRKLEVHLKNAHKIVIPTRTRKRIPKDAPPQVQPTSTQTSSDQVYYVQQPAGFAPHEGRWASQNELFGP
ncbi:hypothetical protein BGW80DRAFT_1463194 [Lactifluus volemus]|nr:hypothetical protein BGW80DRAFT_1463194 [Lactifluus volemus]